MNHEPNELIRTTLNGLENLGAKEKFEEPTYWKTSEIFPVKKPVDLIDDVSLISDVDRVIKKTKNKDVYWWCCLVLNRLMNSGDPAIAEYLIKEIKVEKINWKIERLISPLTVHGASNRRIVELIYLLEHPHKGIRSNAIEMMKFCDDPIIEEPLLNILKTSGNTYEIQFTLWSMSKVVSKKSLSTLKELVYHKKQDIKYTALGYIAKIVKGSDKEYYLNLLKDKNFREKDVVTKFIREYCGFDGVPAIGDRIRVIETSTR